MNEVISKFNKIAKDYDKQRKELIPVFDEFYGIAIESINLTKNNPRVLEIGCGTGLFSEMFLKKFPDANMDLVDLTESMLDIALERLKNYKNLNFFLTDILDFSPNEKYDLIISSLAIHHLKYEDQEQLYKNIFKWLNNEGIFVNAEMVAGESEYITKINENWVNSKLKNNNSMDDENKNLAIDRMKLDNKIPVSIHLKWLKNSGFSNIDCFYKTYCFSVLWGKK